MHPDLHAAGLTQGGVFTTRQAQAAGYTPDELRALLRNQRIVRVCRGIYTDPSWHHPAYELATAAVLLACAKSRPVASHRCAARLLGLPLVDPPDLPEITVPEASPLTTVRRAHLHHGRVAKDEWQDVHALRVTTAARTAVDLARTLDFPAAVVVADAVLHRNLATPHDLGRAAGQFRGRPRSAALARVLAFADAGSESVGESLARVLFAEHGLPAPTLGQRITVDGEVVARVDFLWEEHRTIVEFDGRLKYEPGSDRGADALWQEKLREERLREAGYEVVRITWAQLMNEPERTVARIRAAFARQSTQLIGS